ncbi:hypothetical protein Ccrd_015244 [Cynara cardunculus var. scolymus]|uniref:Uncharacterized protein n=1 Tax=Cynara cardunculus var. scolymus TaxID=59895 RepID=A0A103YC86_CYNCS|nr:hypothetical protein Ccrd_015244 [Cynara cardunculus var. scolymus]
MRWWVLFLPATCSDRHVPHGASCSPVPLAALAKMARLVDVGIVVVTKLGVHAVTTRARENLIGFFQSLRLRICCISFRSGGGLWFFRLTLFIKGRSFGIVVQLQLIIRILTHTCGVNDVCGCVYIDEHALSLVPPWEGGRLVILAVSGNPIFFPNKMIPGSFMAMAVAVVKKSIKQSSEAVKQSSETETHLGRKRWRRETTTVTKSDGDGTTTVGESDRDGDGGGNGDGE